jgi:hypothetical protein
MNEPGRRPWKYFVVIVAVVPELVIPSVNNAGFRILPVEN